MRSLSDVLRALHLAVEEVVYAEGQASDEYANELYSRVETRLSDLIPMVRELRR